MWFKREREESKFIWETIGANKALTAQVAAQQAYLDWLTIRVTQLEKERAQLLFNYTGVKVEVPVVSRVPPVSAEEMLGRAPSFDGLNDKDAEALGISWNPDGTINYKG